jgi:hypothetical protein
LLKKQILLQKKFRTEDGFIANILRYKFGNKSMKLTIEPLQKYYLAKLDQLEKTTNKLSKILPNESSIPKK